MCPSVSWYQLGHLPFLLLLLAYLRSIFSTCLQLPGEVPGTPPRAGVERTRPRVESPQRGEVGATHPVWDDTWLREVTIDEALVEAQLDGADMGELLEVPEGIPWPPDELLASMEAHSRGTSPLRNAAVV